MLPTLSLFLLQMDDDWLDEVDEVSYYLIF